ncbi:hypothetical protein [Intrasporangium flavum]|uniref:hypothetical protein n=1 Tax=Intrasporangium flavum TaxID=1428657 RepID=UPI001A964E1F|nr:hypothetical protein [Intrasporangium flavum]
MSGGRTAQQVTRRYRTEVGASWWAALAVVTVALGLLGRSAGGFWSPFLWSVVTFVLGSLVALAVSAARVPARSADEAFADHGPAGGQVRS